MTTHPVKGIPYPATRPGGEEANRRRVSFSLQSGGKLCPTGARAISTPDAGTLPSVTGNSAARHSPALISYPTGNQRLRIPAAFV